MTAMVSSRFARTAGRTAIVLIGLCGIAGAARVARAGDPPKARAPSAGPGAVETPEPRSPGSGSPSAPSPPGAIQLRDVTRETGITFVHTDGSSGRRYIVESVCCGLATFDYDNDGDVDIYFLNGAPLPGTKAKEPPTNQLWRNDGGFRFTNVTREAGVGDTGYGLGVAVGDYDDDGWQDIFVNNFGPCVLYRNNGDGTFADVTKRAGVVGPGRVGAGASFLDIDADGDLDLFVSHYVGFTFETHATVRFNGHPAYVGPMNYPPMPNTLLRNEGNGTFVDVSVPSGVAAHAGSGMGMVCGDFDDDGDTDIYVGNDEMGNFLLLNDGKGRFEEDGLFAGLAYDFRGKPKGTMGVDAGDVDNDGLVDIFETSYQQEMTTLFRNLGGGAFEDVTQEANAGRGGYSVVKWGIGMVDLDNDGFRDIYYAVGHLHDNVELFDNSTSYEAKNVVLRNLGGGKFANVSEESGDGLQVKLSSRGVACDDLDGDGRVDVVVLNSRKPPTILRNESPGGNRWLEVRLRGVESNRDGVGSRVKVVAGDLALVDEVRSGRGYQSHFGTRLHFGLGKRDRVDRIEVRWLGGGTDIVEDVAAVDRVLTIVEGSAPAGGATAR